MSSITQKLINIQKDLEVPKNQYNAFGKYKYRSAEDIFEAVKPLLDKQGLLLTVTDNVVLIGERYYVKATATISDGEKEISSSAFAREPLSKKGMDESQISCATSSYARKYAMNGLLAIDDTKDSDSMNNNKTPEPPERTIEEVLEDACKGYIEIYEKEVAEGFYIVPAKIKDALKEKYKKLPPKDKKGFVWNDEGVKMLMLMIRLDEVMEEIPQ